MIYLASLSQSEIFPADALKLLIARIPIKNMEKYNIHHVPDASPSFGLLSDIKQHRIEWREYVKRFRKEMTYAPFQAVLDKIEKHYWDKDIILICYCANEKNCHRRIVGNYFLEMGYEVVSL